MKILKWFTENHWISFIVSMTLVITSGQEVWAEVEEDLSAVRMGSHHGVLLLGLFHVLKTLPDLFGRVKEVRENIEKVEGKQEATIDVMANRPALLASSARDPKAPSRPVKKSVPTGVALAHGTFDEAIDPIV